MSTKSVFLQRNHRKRFVGWALFYLFILLFFIFIIYKQASKVNTLELPSGQLQLLVSKSKYKVGQTVTFSIKNNFSKPIYLINKCPQEYLHVYQFTNGSWQRIHDKAISCPSKQQKIAIAPGGVLTKNYAEWPKLFAKPGIYRLVAYADNYSNLAYADFQVISPGQSNQPMIIYKPVYTPIYITSPSGGDHSTGTDN